MPRAKTTTKAALENGSSGVAIENDNQLNNISVDKIEVKSSRGTKRAATQTKGREKKVDSNGQTEHAQDQPAEVKKTSKGRAKKEKKNEVVEEPIKKPTVKGNSKKVTSAENENSVQDVDVVTQPTTGRSKSVKTTSAGAEVNSLEIPKGRTKGRAKSPVVDGLVESDKEAKTVRRKPEKTTVQETKARGRKKMETTTVDIVEEAAPSRRRVKKQSIESTEIEIEIPNRLKPRSRKVAAAAPAAEPLTTTKRGGAKLKNEIVAEKENHNEITETIVKKKGRPVKASAQLEEKPTKMKRGAAKPKEDEADIVEVAMAEEKKDLPVSTKLRGRKRAAPEIIEEFGAEADSADGAKPSKAKKPAPLNATDSIYHKADFELPKAADEDANGGERFNLKVSSWNVAGLRSWLKKGGLKFLEYEEPDIFCLQETKCSNDQLPPEVVRIPGYHPYWNCMPGGYAGVAVYSKIMPITVEKGIGNEEFDDVGRMITAEYEKFYLICTYVPNSGRKLVNLEARMRWEVLFQEYVKKLDALKPVLICGDMNVSHLEIDLANPKSNTKNAGFTKEERDKMTELLALGFVDTFRYLYPKRTGAYTFWTYMANARLRNVGWRLDYFIVSERWTNRIVDNCIRSLCWGSDHCPITLFMKL